MLSSSLEGLNEEFFKRLCNDRHPESASLDFKRQLPDSSDKGKEEFKKDVCAFANSDGGDLVYGIDEGKNDNSHKIDPITISNFEQELLRYRSLLEDIEPRISGVEFKSVSVTDGLILVIRVPSSFNAPHGFNKNDFWKFPMRNGAKTTFFSYEQLRSAFDRTATITQQARQFIKERHQVIIDRKWMHLCEGPICVLHLLPISGLANRSFLDVKKVYERRNELLGFDNWPNSKSLMNLDGLALYATEEGKVCEGVQAFRNGSLEGITSGGASQDREKFIPSIKIATFYRQAFIKFMSCLKKMEYAGPAVASFALLSVGDYRFPGNKSHGYGYDIKPADRSELILPDIWIEDIQAISDQKDADAIVRPAMDILWQCFSFQECDLYDIAGNWSPNRN